MRLSRLLLGIALGILVLGALWYGGWVLPPEGLSRRMAVLHAAFPGSVDEAEATRIDCPPLRRLRFYTVCTRNCEGVWRLVLVKGLRARTIANLGRTPPEPVSIGRQRLNAEVGREAMRLDAEEARQMIACHMRLDGWRPELLLPEGGLEVVEDARREGEEAMRRLAESLDVPGAESRISVEAGPEGFKADLLYWDTWREGHPVLRLRVDLARDGQMRGLRVWRLPAEARETAAPEGQASE
jgi:hypothetical protein